MRISGYGRICILALLGFALIALAGCGRDKDAEKKKDDSGLEIQIERPAQTLGVIGTAPDFTLVNQDGKEVRSQDLRGKVLLFNFIYTSCTTVCPTTSAMFAQTRDELKKEGLLGDKVMLVSISFDPERDTPAVLKKYGETYRVDPANWLWLTGPQTEIDRVVRDGFMVYYGKVPPLNQPEAAGTGDASGAQGHQHQGDEAPPPGYDLEHTSISVLVDREGKMRAFYPGSGVEPKEFVKDIKRLLK